MRLAEAIYRLALRSYPARYRAARGGEILDTLIEAHGSRALPNVGEVTALVRSGLGERNGADLARGRPWWRALGALAIPLASVNGAVALAGLAVAWSLPNGPGRWWPAFAVLALALAVATAAHLARTAALLGLASLAVIALDAATMAKDAAATPHLRVLEHYPSAPAGVAHPPFSASVPSNPTELVPFAVVLALACLGVFLSKDAAPLRARARLVRAGLVLGTAAALAGFALADPEDRFAFLVVPALAIALAGLVAGLVYARAAVIAVALLVATAPSVFWHLSAGARIERWQSGAVSGTSSTRDIVPGLVAVAVMTAAATLAAALARRRARRQGDGVDGGLAVQQR